MRSIADLVEGLSRDFEKYPRPSIIAFRSNYSESLFSVAFRLVSDQISVQTLKHFSGSCFCVNKSIYVCANILPIYIHPSQIDYSLEMDPFLFNPVVALNDRASFLRAIRNAKRIASGKKMVSACIKCRNRKARCDGFRPCQRCCKDGKNTECSSDGPGLMIPQGLTSLSYISQPQTKKSRKLEGHQESTRNDRHIEKEIGAPSSRSPAIQAACPQMIHTAFRATIPHHPRAEQPRAYSALDLHASTPPFRALSWFTTHPITPNPPHLAAIDPFHDLITFHGPIAHPVAQRRRRAHRVPDPYAAPPPAPTLPAIRGAPSPPHRPHAGAATAEAGSAGPGPGPGPGILLPRMVLAPR